MIQNASLEPVAEKTTYAEKYMLFEKFSQSAFGRLGLDGCKEIDLAGLWNKSESFAVSHSVTLTKSFPFFFLQFSWICLCLKTFRRRD